MGRYRWSKPWHCQRYRNREDPLEDNYIWCNDTATQEGRRWVKAHPRPNMGVVRWLTDDPLEQADG